MGFIQCQPGYKHCGSGDENTVLCIHNDQKCPINHVEINNATNLPKPGYETIPLGDSVFLSYTSKHEGLPIVRFKLTEGMVCADSEEQTTSENRTLYGLLKNVHSSECRSKIGNSYYDTSYERVGSIKEETLYKDNGVMEVVEKLPHYPLNDSAKYDWNLYAQPYHYWRVD